MGKGKQQRILCSLSNTQKYRKFKILLSEFANTRRKNKVIWKNLKNQLSQSFDKHNN